MAKFDTKPLAPFGREIKIRLMDMGKSQSWLIEQVKERTGDFFDSSYLYRIMTGAVPAERGYGEKPGKADVIREILGMEANNEQAER